MTADRPSPRQTGHADFPHPAFAGRSLYEAFTGLVWLSSSASLACPGVREQPRGPLGRRGHSVFCLRPGFAPCQSAPVLFESASSCQGPLAPRALPRFRATMGLSDSPASSARLMDSTHAALRLGRSRCLGSPSLPNPTVPTRCPHSPRRSPPLLVNIASRRIFGFGTFDRLADLTLCNEADTGSLALRLAGSLHGASTPELLPVLSASLHAGRSVGMMNTLQFIGLGWRCWRTESHRSRE